MIPMRPSAQSTQAPDQPPNPAAEKRKQTQSRILALATLVVVALCGYFFEELKEWFPWLTAWQIRSYNWVSQLEARKPRLKFVTTVEIDDRTFYDTLHLPSGGATDRKALADMLLSIAPYRPAVIALDINLSREPADDLPPRSESNEALRKAIGKVVEQRIPVVLTCGIDTENGYRRRENIFSDASLAHFADETVPYRARIGFDNAGDELRKVPLEVDARASDGASRPYKSFALEIADAYETVLGIRQHTVDRLAKQIARRQFVYTSFRPQDEFPKISAADVLADKEEELHKLTHRIVLIGGNRHDPPGESDNTWIDDHSFPPLRMRGMYFQANYVEGLLDDRIRSRVPRLVASVLDLGLAVAMMYFARLGKRLWARLALMGVFLVPIVLAYIASVNLGYVIDFVLPVLLLFIHVFLEHYIHLLFPEKEAA